MQDLPHDLRVIAVDLRGYGGTEHAPIDATRGVRDFSDDVHATLDDARHPRRRTSWAGRWAPVVILQYALDHPVLSLTLESPISPYGFGGTRRDGSRLTDDDAGMRRRHRESRVRAAADRPRRERRGADLAAQRLPRPLRRPGLHHRARGRPGSSRCCRPRLRPETTRATRCPSENWPGMAPGTIGVLNTMAPRYFNVSGDRRSRRQAPDPVDPRRCSTPSCRTRRSTTSTISASSGSSPAGRAWRSLRRRRWSRRPAMCSTRTPPPAAR